MPFTSLGTWHALYMMHIHTRKQNTNIHLKILLRKDVQSYMPVIGALRRSQQENYKIKASLGYLVRLCVKKQNKGLSG